MTAPLTGNDSPPSLDSYPDISECFGVPEDIGPVVVRCPTEYLASSLPADVPYDERVHFSPVLGYPIAYLTKGEPRVLLGEEYVNVSACRCVDEIPVEFLGERTYKEALLSTLRHEVVARRRPPSEIGKLAFRTFRDIGIRRREDFVRETGLGDMLAEDLYRLSTIEQLCGKLLRNETLSEANAVTLCALDDRALAKTWARKAAKNGISTTELQTLIMNFTDVWERSPIRRFWGRWCPETEWCPDIQIDFTKESRR